MSMAKFRDSSTAKFEPATGAEDAKGHKSDLHDRSIGDIIREAKNLTPDQLDAVAAYQREHRVRFGEAAIALGFATEQDVLSALSKQFHYPYSPEEQHCRFSDELVVANEPFSQQAEAFRAIRSRLILHRSGGDVSRRAVAVVSPDSGDGKTFFSANLAVALSQLGGRTLLVDADLRGPRQHSIFGMANTTGLSGVLSGRAEANVIQRVADLPSLYVLPVGNVPPNPLELFERPVFGLLMNELSSKFDYVVVDTPAAVYGADASVIASKCGSALVVARRGSSHISSLEDLLSSLAQGKTDVVGVVMNEY
jgi:chain length determinant protein tyrosine kinase EpsG